MTKKEVCDKWKLACAARESKGYWVRNGNMVDIAFALRHKDCEAATVTVVEQEGSTILKVEPAPLKPAAGKSGGQRPAFYLIVT